jgi:hypothetical protein
MNYWQGRKIRLRAIEVDDAQTFYQWNLDSERARLLDFVWPPSSLAAFRPGSKPKLRNQLEDDRFRG